MPNAYFSERPDCPVCGASDADELYRNPLTNSPVRDMIASHYAEQGHVEWAMLQDVDYVLMGCNRCGLVYQRHVPDAVLLEQIYDVMVAPDYLAQIELDRLTTDQFARIAGELAALFDRIGIAPGKARMLDYGFGSGRWARVARALGAEVFVSEVSAARFEIARSIGVTVVDDHAIDAMAFDIVHTEQVFEHLTHPRETFARLARSTRGLMKIAVPPGDGVRALVTRGPFPSVSPYAMEMRGEQPSATDALWSSVQPLEHLNCFTHQTIALMAEEHGLKIVDRRRQRHIMVPLPSARGLKFSAAELIRGVYRAAVPQPGYFLLGLR